MVKKFGDWIKAVLGTEIPEEDEVGDIEASARFFQEENGELHILDWAQEPFTCSQEDRACAPDQAE